MTPRMAGRILVTALLLSPLSARAQSDGGFPFLEATVAQLQAEMASGRLTSEQLTRAYIERIHALDSGGPGVNSIMELNPDASGLSSMMELTPGPPESSAWIRSMYARVSCSDVRRPEAISACSCATVASRKGNPPSDWARAESGESSNAVTRIRPAMRGVMSFLLC